MKTTSNRIFIGVLLLAGALSAEDGPRGHWTGTIDVPGHPLAVEIDLDKAANGWIGSISIPDQGASGLPLEAITFANGKCSFRIKGAPGEPTFGGALSADGKTLSGEFTQEGGSMHFSVSRAGDAKVETTKKSPPVAKEFVGSWEGTLQAGQPLRMLLKLANDENGSSAVLVSLDQGDAQIPVAAIEQKDAKLTLLVKAIGGEYRGDINKDGTELNGVWTQSGIEIPLKLKKQPDASAKP